MWSPIWVGVKGITFFTHVEPYMGVKGITFFTHVEPYMDVKGIYFKEMWNCHTREKLTPETIE